MVYLTGKANAAGLVPISQFRRCKISAMSIYIYTHMIHLQLWSSSWGSRHQTVSFCISKLISQKCQYASEAQIKTALLPINENCELPKNRAERRERAKTKGSVVLPNPILTQICKRTIKSPGRESDGASCSRPCGAHDVPTKTSTCHPSSGQVAKCPAGAAQRPLARLIYHGQRKGIKEMCKECNCVKNVVVFFFFIYERSGFWALHFFWAKCLYLAAVPLTDVRILITLK